MGFWGVLTRNDMGFWGVLTILFIALKLCGVISWSWWLVLAPLWGVVLFIIVVYAAWFTWIIRQ